MLEATVYLIPLPAHHSIRGRHSGRVHGVFSLFFLIFFYSESEQLRCVLSDISLTLQTTNGPKMVDIIDGPDQCFLTPGSCRIPMRSPEISSN